jgi:type IV secretory pathway TrbD component
MQPTLRRWLASTALLLTCTLAWLLSTLRRRLLAAVAKPLLLAAAPKSLVVAEAVLAAALKSPAVAETVFSVTVLPAALKSLLTVLAAALLLVATAESDPRSVRAVCSERFSRASQAVMLLLVIRVAAPAEAFLLPLHRSHRLQ